MQPRNLFLLPPQKVEPIARLHFYIDTVEAFLHSTSPHDRRRLKNTFRGADWWYDDIKIEGRTIGYRVKLQFPQRQVLRELDSMLQEFRGYDGDKQGSITRLDYAGDFEALGEWKVNDVERWIKAHLIVPNRRAGEIFRYENSNYFTKNAQLSQNSRDVVLYSDKPSKPRLFAYADTSPIAHLDIRLRGKQTIEAEGIRTLADAIEKNPAAVLFSHVYFTSIDIEPHATAWAEASIVGAPDAERTRAFIVREQLDFAQRVKERLHVPMLQDECPPLIVPQHLEWLPHPYGRKQAE